MDYYIGDVEQWARDLREGKLSEQELARVACESVFVVECPHCGMDHRVEPDADYPCPSCGEGQLLGPYLVIGT